MSATITRVTARAVSFRVPPELQVALGIGRTVKRDAVLVRVDTDAGISGWGEAHAARAPSAIAELINTTLAGLVCGMDAFDTDSVWARVYRMQLASHGAGAAAVIGLSGIDLALWDIKGRAVNQPVYKLLGGGIRPIEAYAGGITLGYMPPAELVAEAQDFVEQGYRALKLRLGDTPANDLTRVQAVRAALGPDIAILTDANTAYSASDFAAVADGLIECNVGWLEEPFPAPEFASYREAARWPALTIAAGENHYTRFDFARLAEERIVRVWQPDLSKVGGLTEALRIAALAAEHGIAIHPHTSLTALNMSASLSLLCAIPNGGYFEADLSRHNPLRDHFGDGRIVPASPAHFMPLPGAGFGVQPDEDIFERFPVISGAGYV